VQHEHASPPPARPARGPLGRLLATLAVVAVLFVSGRLALIAANPSGLASAVWPPVGIAMAVLLHHGARAWIVPFAGALALGFTNLLPAPGHGDGVLPALALSLATATGSTLALVAGAMAIRRATGTAAGAPAPLTRPREILRFAAWGGIFAPGLAALIGATSLLVAGRIPAAVYGFTWLTWFVGDSIGVLIFTPVTLAVIGREQPLWRQRHRSVILPLLITSALVLGVFVYGRERYETRQAHELEQIAERLRRVLRQDMGAEIELLHVLEQVYGAIDGSNPRAFHALARHRMEESSVVAAVAWVAESPHGGHRAIWVAAQSGREVTPSTAISADHEIPRALARARVTGALATTAARPRLLGQGDTPVLWVFTPVPAGARANAVRGYFGVALSLDGLVGPLRGLASSARVHAWLEDPGAPAGAAQRVALDPDALDPAALPAGMRGLEAVRELRIADRAWRVRVAPTAAFLSGADSVALWFTLAGSLGFTGMLGMFLLGFSGRHAAVEAQVAERTAALMGAKLHLEREIAERERAQTSLAAAALAAEAASRAKTRFLNTMSHEVRTPMNAVMGMTQLLAFTELDAEQRECVEAIHGAGAALLALVDDVLDMARVESGRMQLDPRPFALRATLQSVCVLLGARARGQGLDLGLDVAGDVPDELVGDSHRLRQVLVNLVGNAIKFTERGSVRIDAAVHAREHAAVALCFRVTDTGIGIAEDRRDIIFEAFEQGDPSLARRFGGTGLGLSISSELVQLMGGRIWVESRLGEGSVFSFTARFGLTDDARGLAASAGA
jgi:two-component system sensor histidine kinase/response regulator